MNRPKPRITLRNAKTKRLLDYVAPLGAPFTPPSFDTVKAEVLRQKGRKVIWSFQETKSLYDTRQISRDTYFKILGELAVLGNRMTDEIQDFLEGCVTEHRRHKARMSTRTQKLLKLRREQPQLSLEEIVADVKRA